MAAQSSRLREIAGLSLKVGVASVAGLLGWVVGGKIIALELGAAGVGVFGLLRQLLQNLSVFATFNGTNALVQGIASRSGEARDGFAHTVARMYAIGAGLVALGLLGGAHWLGPWLVPHADGPALLRWMALAVVVASAQAYFTGLLNGYRAVNRLVWAQMAGPAVLILLALPLARMARAGLSAGLALMLVVPGAAVAAVALVQARKAGWFAPTRHPGLSRADAGSFLRMSGVLLVSGLLVTGTQYFQNRLVAERFGLEEAGQFWVAWTMSMTYVTVLLGSYGTYYMPALSALAEPQPRQALIRDYLRLSLLAMPVIVSLVVVVKPWVVLLLFSPKLLPALKVMRWMLIGDFFKGVGWILAFPMLAFNQMRWFFWTEATFSLGMAGGAWAWVAMGGGVDGLGLVFALAYLLYLPVMGAYIWMSHRFRPQWGEVMRFLGGLALVGGLSIMTWNDTQVRVLPLAAFVTLAGLFILLSLRGHRVPWGRIMGRR